MYTFCQTTTNTKSINPKFFKSTFSPTSQGPQIASNEPKSNQSSAVSCFRRPNRTKTTEFSEEQLTRKSPNLYIPLMQNKVFFNSPENSQTNLSKGSNGYLSSTPTIPEEISENLPTTKSISLNAIHKNEPETS